MKTTYKKLLAKVAQYEKKDALVRLSASSGAGTKKIQAALLRGKAVFYKGKSEGGVAHVALYYQTSGGKVKAVEAKVDVTKKAAPKKATPKKPKAKKAVVHKRPSKKTLKEVKKPVVKKPRVAKAKPGDARRRTVAAKPADAKHQARLARARAKRQAERGRTFVPDPEKYQRTVKDVPRYAAPGQGVQVRVGLAPAGKVWWDPSATNLKSQGTAEALHSSAYDDASCATCGRDADGCVCDECDCEMCSSLGHGGKGFEYLRAESLPLAPNEHDVSHLVMIAVNDGELYRKRTQPSLINLQAKYRQGQYDPNAAITVWRLLADDARRQYAKEFGAEAARVFNGPVRDAAARELEAYYRGIIAGSENA
jgi:hypothetical protein